MLWLSEHLHLGDEGRAGAQGQRIVQRGFAKLMHSTSSRDGVLRKRERGDEGRAGAQERARMSVGNQSTPSLGFADVSWR